jgi:hypothetical protein
MIQLPEMKLIERSDVVTHIARKMVAIDERVLFEMKKVVNILGRKPNPKPQDAESESEEEDIREDTSKAIFQFLFLRYARYAILSHTWLQTGEIIYSDTLKEGWLDIEGPGCQKLRGFCEVAHRDHDVTLAWMDTLCINKDSSAELDESIQSMYKWYQNSSVCITHLRLTTSLDDMKSDNWFRRGWTLQELVAPKNMQFYCADWTPLTPTAGGNDKANPQIQEIIFSATGIDPKELVSFDPLTGSDIATRMSWAASRTTTRGEDRAYSLMGIFGVNLPISYGEGPERAFFRLIDAIISARHTSHIIQALNWAGKSVSDPIHTSRLIPSQPECYFLNADLADGYNLTATSTYFPNLSDPMVLTHLGLRVRLLLIRAESYSLEHDPKQTYGPFNITLKVQFPLFTFQTLEALLERRYSEIPDKHSHIYHTRKPGRFGSSLYLGIYTFKEDDHQGCVDVPFSSFALILSIPNPYDNFTIHDLYSNHFEPSAKIDTRNVVQVPRIQTTSAASRTPNLESADADGQKFDTIRKSDLAGMNMKLLNVYL